MEEKFVVRLAKRTELSSLNEIENAAAYLFENTKYASEILQSPLSLSFLERQQQDNLVWVAVNTADIPVGFAVVIIFDRWVHLHELSVLPSYGRRGIGTHLVEEIINWARKANYPRVTLSTFRDIPWNAPFYRRLGFTEIPPTALSRELIELRKEEAAAGLPVEERIIMTREI